MKLDVLKDIRTSSCEGKIIISAKKEIILTRGEDVWQKFGGKSITQAAQEWESADFAVTPEVRWPYDESPVAGQMIRLVSGDGTEQTLTTASSGTAPKQSGVNVDSFKAYLQDEE